MKRIVPFDDPYALHSRHCNGISMLIISLQAFGVQWKGERAGSSVFKTQALLNTSTLNKQWHFGQSTVYMSPMYTQTSQTHNIKVPVKKKRRK